MLVAHTTAPMPFHSLSLTAWLLRCCVQVSEYAFDALYNSEDTTSKVFKDLALPLVSLLIEGFNGTIFAYGQTGSGKTHSMMGNEKDPGTCVQPSQAKPSLSTALHLTPLSLRLCVHRYYTACGDLTIRAAQIDRWTGHV